MVAAVSNAGAYGMLALGFIDDPEEARRLIREVRKLTDKPFGANVVLLNPRVREILTVLAEEGIKTITTSVGRPDIIYPLSMSWDSRGYTSYYRFPMRSRHRTQE